MAKKPKSRRSRKLLKWTAILLAAPIVVSFLLILPLRWFDPATSAFRLQDDTRPQLHEWTDLSDMSSSMPLAVVASEDQRFAEHFGVDWVSIRKSIDEAGAGGRMRGASTITQQLAKNLFLSPSRNILRKGVEAYLSVVIEICLPKRRILEIYLNIIELGPGVYGVGAGSRRYFGKSPATLSDYDAALLAAVLPNPIRLQVDKPSPYVRKRQGWIVGQVARLRRESWLLRIQ